MNKVEIAEKVAQEFELTKKLGNDIVDYVFDLMEKELIKGHDVKISGFGNFSVKKRAARTAMNPATGAKVKVPASKKAAFKQSKNLKEQLNAKKK